MATVTLRPAGVGAETNIAGTTPASQAHWDMVNEDPSDGGTTSVNTGQAGGVQRDVYTIEANSIPVGSTINSVQVFINSRTTSAM